MEARALAVFVALAVLGSGAVARGQQGAPQVSIQAERSAVALGEPFWVSITVEAQSPGVLVSLPPGSPFEVLRQGGSSSFSFSFGGGTQRSQQTIRWQLRALRPGRQTLGPLVVTVGGQQYRTGTTDIDVLSGGATPPAPAQPPAGPGATVPGQTHPGAPPQQTTPIPEQIEASELSGAIYDNEMFLRTVVEPPEAFVGQQLVMKVYLYRRIRLDEYTLSREPTTEGFWVEDIGRAQEEYRQFVGQTMFVVNEVKRTAIFPLREGTLTIGAPRIEGVTGFSLFSRRASTIVRDGVPVDVVVRPLPESGRPERFEYENVGRFSIQSGVDRRASKVGEPVTYTITVSGEGNLRKVKVQPLEDIVGARVYDPRVNEAVAVQEGRLVGERRWEYLILPQREGNLELPPVALSFFDPVSKSYRTQRTDAVTIDVSGRSMSNSGESSDDGGDADGGEAHAETEPLHLIRRQAELSSGTEPVYERWWFVALLVLAPLGWVVVIATQSIRRHRNASRDAVRSRQAAQVARRALASVQRAEGNGAIGKIHRIFNEFFVARMRRPMAGMTSDELRAFLGERGVEEALARRVVGFVERCERARFAGGEDGAEGAADLADEATELVALLDRASWSKGKGERP